MDKVHLFYLLHLVSAKSTLRMRVPFSLVKGFGFTSPTVIETDQSILRFKKPQSSTRDFILNNFNYEPCIVVVKTRTQTFLLSDLQEVMSYFNKEKNIVIQRYVSELGKQSIIRIRWRYPKSVSASLYSGPMNSIRRRKPTSVFLSESNKDLLNYVCILKAVLQNTVFRDKKLVSFEAEFIKSPEFTWYLLGIHSYQAAETSSQKNLRQKVTELEQPKPATQGLPRNTLTPNTTQNTFKFSFRLQSPKSPPYINAPKRIKELNFEEEISELVGNKQVTSLKFMNTRLWNKRIEPKRSKTTSKVLKPNLTNIYCTSTQKPPDEYCKSREHTIDRAYAKFIAKKSRKVLKHTQETTAELQDMIEAMNQIVSPRQTPTEPPKTATTTKSQFIFNRFLDKKLTDFLST